jgi:hypothetical protein
MNTTNDERLRYLLSEVKFDENYFHLHLADGRILSIPFELVPSLSRAKKSERENCLIEGMGTALYWPDLDEDLSVEGLVLGRKIIDWQKKKA